MRRARKALRILVVDDHPIVREGIRMCLKSRKDIEVVGEAADGLEAIEWATKVNPDVVLMDLTMPRMGGFEALPKIRSARPKARVIIVTVHNSREYLRKAMAARVDGYLLKDTAPSEYIEAIKSVSEGRLFVSPALARETEKDPRSIVARRFGLTSRELEFLALAVEGKRGAEIAETMNCSSTAVRSYRRRTMFKLRVDTLAALTRVALENGF